MGELDAQWADFRERLAAYLATMVDPEETDHLIVELPDQPDAAGCPPYAQFAAFGDGRLLRAEIVGDGYLAPQYRLDDAGRAFLQALGWRGGDDGPEASNWHREVPVDDALSVAHQVTATLRTRFGIAHPQLLTYQAWGPAAAHAADLGLCATDEVPVEQTGAPGPTGADPTGLDLLAPVTPTSRDDLVAVVAALLRTRLDAEPEVDDDGDFVLHHLGQLVWIRVREDQPAVEILAVVAHGVRSRRATAVELSILNRGSLWVRWILRDHTVWQTLPVPAGPFVPAHLDAMLDLYLETMAATRADLLLRTGGKEA